MCVGERERVSERVGEKGYVRIIIFENCWLIGTYKF